MSEDISTNMGVRKYMKVKVDQTSYSDVTKV